MKGKGWYAALIVMVFFSGANVANNLGKLVPINASYEASWVKVGVSVFLCIAASIIYWYQKDR